MYFQKGKNFIHISSKNFQQLTNYIIIFESFFKEEKREISHSLKMLFLFSDGNFNQNFNSSENFNVR